MCPIEHLDDLGRGQNSENEHSDETYLPTQEHHIEETYGKRLRAEPKIKLSDFSQL
jgi:hypothetical protein